MPARKGDCPFIGLTNEARKTRVSARRDAILLYLRGLDEHVSVRQLASEFEVSLRTMMYDLDFLYSRGCDCPRIADGDVWSNSERFFSGRN